MIELETRSSQDICSKIGREGRVFFIGCSGRKGLCSPGGESRLQKLRGELQALGVRFTGTVVWDELCTKGLDELSLLGQFRQAGQADLFLVLSCEAGVQAVAAAAGKKTEAALRTLSAPGLEGIWGEEGLCRLCGSCLLDLSGGLCPLYFCPKGLLNGPCQGASRGRCEVDSHNPCGWERVYERLKARGELGILGGYAEPRDYSKMLPLFRLRSQLAAEGKEG